MVLDNVSQQTNKNTKYDRCSKFPGKYKLKTHETTEIERWFMRVSIKILTLYCGIQTEKALILDNNTKDFKPWNRWK